MKFEEAASKGLKENLIGNWIKGDICYAASESFVILLPAVMWVTENVPINWVIKLRRFQVRMLKMPPGFFLLLILRCKREG